MNIKHHCNRLQVWDAQKKASINSSLYIRLENWITNSESGEWLAGASSVGSHEDHLVDLTLTDRVHLSNLINHYTELLRRQRWRRRRETHWVESHHIIAYSHHGEGVKSHTGRPLWALTPHSIRCIGGALVACIRCAKIIIINASLLGLAISAAFLWTNAKYTWTTSTTTKAWKNTTHSTDRRRGSRCECKVPDREAVVLATGSRDMEGFESWSAVFADFAILSDRMGNGPGLWLIFGLSGPDWGIKSSRS